jgi:putative ABC transport system permease protein
MTSLRALRFAWLTIVRQPARSVLGVLGVAAVGALLFDMLLLSRGLVLSFRTLLDTGGFDARVLATDMVPFSGPRLDHASTLAAAIAALPEVAAVQQVRTVRATAGDRDVVRGADVDDEGGDNGEIEIIGTDVRARSFWTMAEGRDVAENPATGLVINQHLAEALGARPGSTVTLRGRCSDAASMPPAVTFVVTGIATFPFDTPGEDTAGTSIASAARLCGERDTDQADMLLVRSRDGVGAEAAAAAIHARRPDLHVVTNAEIVDQFSRLQFSYFRQISSVLATVTLFFGFLLVAVLLTVSVNQHLGEIATLRAIGLTRGRVVAGIFWESIIMVGTGGVFAVPIGFVVAAWLDRILRRLPGIPTGLHFFVFEPRALALYVVLLSAAALAAAAYPMRIVAGLPIAGTLRQEVVS